MGNIPLILRCPKCHSEPLEPLGETRVATSGHARGITAYRMRCMNCLHVWFSTHPMAASATAGTVGPRPQAACAALIQSNYARKAGPCGAPGVEVHNGKTYCKRHARVQRQRAQLTAEA